MKIIKDFEGSKYIDQELYDHIENIWATFDINVNNDSNIYFTKNTTINKLITDYTNNGISRVIKKEKTNYIVIKEFGLPGYAYYYNGTNVLDEDAGDNIEGCEKIYHISNMTMITQATIETILEMIVANPNALYVNQNKLNETINNGFIMDKDTYITLKELIESNSNDNHRMAMGMLVQSDLKANWQWILYLYFNKRWQVDQQDERKILRDFIDNGDLDLPHSFNTLMYNYDALLSVITDLDVQACMIEIAKEKFQNHIETYFNSYVSTHKFELVDFKIKYNPNKTDD